MSTVGAPTTAVMSRDTSTHTRLTGPWLWTARMVWVALFVVAVVMVVASPAAHFEVLRTPCAAAPCDPQQLTTDDAQSLREQLGLTLDVYAWYQSIINLSFPPVYFILALIIFWRKSDDWMALFV